MHATRNLKNSNINHLRAAVGLQICLLDVAHGILLAPSA
jgi:hypothetical protein